MRLRPNIVLKTVRSRLRRLLIGPQLLAFMPAIVLAGYWLGGESWLVLLALGIPWWLLMVGSFPVGKEPLTPCATACAEGGDRDVATEFSVRQAADRPWPSACMIIELDDFPGMRDRYGADIATGVIDVVLKRLGQAIHESDTVFPLQDGRFVVSLSSMRHPEGDDAHQTVARLQSVVEQPVELAGASVRLSASIGFCVESPIATDDGGKMLHAAELALHEARRHAPSAIRAFSPDMQGAAPRSPAISADVLHGLENGEIQAWFQPQLSTDTGHVTGFEALARWRHPRQGVLPPAEFLPLLERAGRMDHLGDVILNDALRALRAWDSGGLDIARVSVNFSPEELCDPELAARVEWTLDRHDIPPDCLGVEVLETVVSTSPDDTVSRNIRALSDLGCFIDLDDFGTGHASISSIRRFAIRRLKIDRSFLTGVDRDPERQRVVSAILLMAQHLDLETLAEGVESAGEHAMLAQLGCDHVQGFGIARPMPFGRTSSWITAHLEKLGDPPVIGSRTG